jgi:uroporphyrin-III C-methyltransferase/precorrin-2 dehydrogenase/sirohydrochlorin ferrochelatase
MTVLRLPSETRPPGIGALARLPLFFALTGRRAVVAGASAAAAWKAELLSAAGASVDVYGPEPSDELLTIAGTPPGGKIRLHHRMWTPEDIYGAAVAVGALDGGDAERFASAAKACGVPVNVVDNPSVSDFSFGSIINRSPLVIGISTDGAAPALAQAIRAKFEALIPRGFARWTDAARRWRERVKLSGLSFEARRRFWRAFSTRALQTPKDMPRDSDIAVLLHAARTRSPEDEYGSVTLVGAGPGDPGLLTLRALEALQSADVILVDDLVAPEILDLARREAKTILVGKTGFGPSCRQDDIDRLMVSLARQGKRVVRLKGGDPMIFGRATEEIAACRAAGIAVEIVPGITAAQGAASRLGISLTARNVSRRIQYITGHAHDGGLPNTIDWRALTDPEATTAVYMPSKTIGRLAERAMAEGLDPSTPAIAVINATRPNETVIVSTIAAIAEEFPARRSDGPCLVLIGGVFAELSASKGLVAPVAIGV